MTSNLGLKIRGATLMPSRILFGLCRQKNGVRLTTGLNCIPIEIMALVHKYRISNSVEKFIPNFVENNSIWIQYICIYKISIFLIRNQLRTIFRLPPSSILLHTNSKMMVIRQQHGSLILKVNPKFNVIFGLI